MGIGGKLMQGWEIKIFLRADPLAELHRNGLDRDGSMCGGAIFCDRELFLLSDA